MVWFHAEQYYIIIRFAGDGWSAWSSWRLCSAQCNGTQTRTRICRSRPSHCPGDDYERRTCKRPGAKCGDEEIEEEEEEEEEDDGFPGKLIKRIFTQFFFAKYSAIVYICISQLMLFF